MIVLLIPKIEGSRPKKTECPVNWHTVKVKTKSKVYLSFTTHCTVIAEITR